MGLEDIAEPVSKAGERETLRIRTPTEMSRLDSRERAPSPPITSVGDARLPQAMWTTDLAGVELLADGCPPT